jgi:hypothetical protein
MLWSDVCVRTAYDLGLIYYPNMPEEQNEQNNLPLKRTNLGMGCAPKTFARIDTIHGIQSFLSSRDLLLIVPYASSSFK